MRKSFCALLLVILLATGGSAFGQGWPAQQNPNLILECKDRCREDCKNTRPEAVKTKCEKKCFATCESALNPAINLSPPIDESSSHPFTKEAQTGPPGSGDSSDLSNAALAATAVLMVTPVIFYAIDKPGSERQFEEYRKPHFSFSGGVGAAFPDSALFRGDALAEWNFASVAMNWLTWERDAERIHRLSPLFGFQLPPQRHSEVRVYGGPTWEWIDGQRNLGGIFALTSTFLLPRRVELWVEPRIGKVGDRMIADVGLNIRIPAGKFVRFILGGQVLFRGSDASGGPEFMIEALPF